MEKIHEETLSDSMLFTIIDRNGIWVRIDKETGKEEIVDHYYDKFNNLVRHNGYYSNFLI